MVFHPRSHGDAQPAEGLAGIMSARYRPDPDVFEALLSNAFAVQESGLDRHSLAALVEIQRFLGPEQLDFDQEMQMVADRTCKLFRASGVAIALLEANE